MLKSIIISAVGMAAWGSVPIDASASQPNIVVILADDLAYGSVGFNGSKKIKTPHLDRMARDGMRLDALYAPCSVCGPSRASQ